ncbi:hypothetical protein F0L68_17275 [Solihabitans fulvus]|uniref:PrgI family protein n=1 Tax=Solihabitans fulvus TaxID=1892852 RepID=A0A5B2XDU7_9PSEU|nr:SCO6880 family protein [Solihabitans fulvus]KAA2261523.1 hypothetical protein F0L68_17275 [Solihabitans fulvus]
MVEPRTYGGWRARRGFGVGNLSESQTIVIAGCVFVPLAWWLAVTTFVLPLVLMLVPTGAVAITLPLALIPHRKLGISLGGAVIASLRTATARRKGWTSWESGVLTAHPRRYELPGVLAPTMPLSAHDGLGRPYGLLWDRRTGRLTTALRLASVGTVLAGQDTTDLWIGSFAGWLAGLGHQPTVQWIAITVESAPGTGTQLAEYVERNIDTTSPPLAQQVMRDVALAHRGSTADITTRVSITFQPQKAVPVPADDAERVAEVSRALSGIEGDLGLCGVAVLGRATAATWTHWIRASYEPSARAELDRLSAEDHLLAWADAGPVTHYAADDHYAHDGGWSVSWALAGLPEQLVGSTILAPLVTPGRYHRRLTITYQPYVADQAAEVVAKEASGSQFRSALRRRRGIDETARDRADEARARQAAEEEAHGAGVGLWGLYITTTVTDPRELKSAIADVESRARGSKLRLRRCWGWQHVGFAASLGTGVYPPELVKRGRWSR